MTIKMTIFENSPPPTITINGREYVNEATYKAMYNYDSDELTKARADGLPSTVHMHRMVAHHYYNLDDCKAFHRGEAV